MVHYHICKKETGKYIVPNLKCYKIENYNHQSNGRLCKIPAAISFSQARFKTLKWFKRL